MNYSRNLTSPVSAGEYHNLPFLYLALPVMDEPEFLPRTLACISAQSYRRFKLVICVNQPDAWWNDPVKSEVCRHNQEILEMLSGWTGCELVVLDRSSKGHGWTGKQHGVGFARKVAMDFISREASPGDIIVSLDADTCFSPNYLLSIALNFAGRQNMVALTVPYYHHLTGNKSVDRAILRYEIYMRHYFLNLAFIGSPYAFSALGSAIAVPLWAYRAIGGMTPKKSGEDFYFLQKLKKFGYVGLWNDEMVYPEARFSDRVFFGTGPAMIKGATGDWSSYPIYPCALFDQIHEAYTLLPSLCLQTIESPVVSFISKIFKEDDPFLPLRRNHQYLAHFIRAFHEKFDGLRILQYLKTTNEQIKTSDEQNLEGFFIRYYKNGEVYPPEINFKEFTFEESPISELSEIREFLFICEMDLRKRSKE